MTAPALPGAAPDPAPGRNDPARLPLDIEDALSAIAYADNIDARLRAIDFLRANIARAIEAEREACAKVCDERAAMHDGNAKAFWEVLGGGHGPSVAKSYEASRLASESRMNAGAIRARGVKP